MSGHDDKHHPRAAESPLPQLCEEEAAAAASYPDREGEGV